MRLRDAVQELRELGPSGTLYRFAREVALRSGAVEVFSRARPPLPAGVEAHAARWLHEAPFAHPSELRSEFPGDASALVGIADRACEGKIVCFGGWEGDFGDPIEWYRDPLTGARWSTKLHWSRALAEMGGVGDVKLTWEAARFPHAYHLARAATFAPERSPRYRVAFERQVRAFLAATPWPFGIHWASSQEMVIRLAAWCFAVQVFSRLGEDMHALAAEVSRYAWAVGHQLEDELPYALRAVYNNHLIAEAFGLELCARLLPRDPTTERWACLGDRILTEQASKQVYRDGAYINQSHNYHRTVLHDYLLAARWRQHLGEPVRAAWTAAMERSFAFLYAQQNPTDGALPNYGGNDGSMPRVLTHCAFSDFRPTLQALSVMTRGRRAYEPGPWDEEAVWLFGPAAVRCPVEPVARTSVSFASTGYHCLRGSDPGCFAVLRCGSVRDRFAQIDMLHLDVWWRGHNVLCDPGSYLYNGAPPWHDHFYRTGSHNTVELDAADQMLHHRRFKNLYWTRSELLDEGTRDGLAWVTGEHHGYERLPGRAVHRRSVLRVSDSAWVVIDRVSGDGTHHARLQWLGGTFPFTTDEASKSVRVETPAGAFAVRVFDGLGEALDIDVVAGRESPPRGWLSRHYGEKVAVPSMVVRRSFDGAITLVSVLAGDACTVDVDAGVWALRTGKRLVQWSVSEGRFSDLRVMEG